MAALGRGRPEAEAFDDRRFPGGVRFALDPEFGTLALEKVTTELIDNYRARLVDEGAISERTINKRLVIRHGILRRAMKVYGLRENAAALVDRQPLRKSLALLAAA